jgi:hypothetical protein
MPALYLTELGSLSLWADEPKFGRVRFHLGMFILMDVLHGANAAPLIPASKYGQSIFDSRLTLQLCYAHQDARPYHVR